MAVLVIPVSGAYTGTWNSNALGVLSDDGFEIGMSLKAQPFDQSDAWGLTMVEAIYRGQDWTVRLVGREWKAALLNIFLAFGQVGTGTLTPHLGFIGDLFTTYAKSLVLTRALTTPTPATLTATQSVLSPNNRSTFNLTSKIRELPLELSLIPYSVTISASPYSNTAYNLPFSIT